MRAAAPGQTRGRLRGSPLPASHQRAQAHEAHVCACVFVCMHTSCSMFARIMCVCTCVYVRAHACTQQPAQPPSFDYLATAPTMLPCLDRGNLPKVPRRCTHVVLHTHTYTPTNACQRGQNSHSPAGHARCARASHSIGSCSLLRRLTRPGAPSCRWPLGSCEGERQQGSNQRLRDEPCQHMCAPEHTMQQQGKPQCLKNTGWLHK